LDLEALGLSLHSLQVNPALTITHYAGEDLKKCNFAWIDYVCVLVCKKMFTLKAKRNFLE